MLAANHRCFLMNMFCLDEKNHPKVVLENIYMPTRGIFDTFVGIGSISDFATKNV
jgi:hypothetical protein